MNPMAEWMQYKSNENRKKIFPILEYIIYGIAILLVILSLVIELPLSALLLFVALIPIYFGVSLTEAFMEGLKRRIKIESLLFVLSLLSFIAILIIFGMECKTHINSCKNVFYCIL